MFNNGIISEITTDGLRFTAPLGEYFNYYVKMSLRCFEYFFVCLVLVGLIEIILLYKELRCIDGSLNRRLTVYTIVKFFYSGQSLYQFTPPLILLGPKKI